MKDTAMKTAFLPIFSMLVILASGSVASAHSFSTLFAAPTSGAEAANGRQALDGFLFAAGERDGHPNETADGHPGGLDVNVLIVDMAAEGEAAAIRAKTLIGRRDVDMLVGATGTDIEADFRRQTNGRPTVFLTPPPQGQPQMLTMDGESLAGSFEKAFGYAPTPWVLAGYRAARIIDRAVRAVDGDFSRTQELNAAFR